METSKNLKNIVRRQKEVFAELQAELQAYENHDYVKENGTLKVELEKLRRDYEQLKTNTTVVSDENARLRNALHEQIYNEKVNLINTTAEKINIYFHSTKNGGLNKLTALENKVTARITLFKEVLSQNNISAQDELHGKIDELSTLLNRKITEVREQATQMSGAFSKSEIDELNTLKDEPLTDEQIRMITKKNNIERFVGLKVLNAIGIFLLIVGSITLAWFTSEGIIIFALGGLMLAWGEYLNRKNPTIFSLGISASGIGILYVALATSYFGFQVLHVYPALLICIMITAVAFLLSNRYNSQTIAAFAMIGGYLPMFSIASNTVILYGAMVYFIVLNILALLISLNKKWRISSFIGLALNTGGTLYICYITQATDNISMKIWTILYVLFAFFVYTAIPIISTYRTRESFEKSDVVLLGFNTLFSSFIMYWAFQIFNLQAYDGLWAIAFAIIYSLLAKMIEIKFPGNEYSSEIEALFYITGLTFVILVIPLQFGQIWLSLGWLIEGVSLATYGIIKNKKAFTKRGLIISILCLLAFIIFDITTMGHYLFFYKYLAITLGSLIILGAYMYRMMMAGQFVMIYKYFVLGNIWIFTMYVIFSRIMGTLSLNYNIHGRYHLDYLLSAVAIVVTFAFAYSFPRIKSLSDFGTKVLSLVLYLGGFCGFVTINQSMTPVAAEYLQMGTPAFGISLVGVIIIFALGVISIFALRDFLNILMEERELNREWYFLILSWYCVLMITFILISQFNLLFTNFIFSIIYVLAALMWIIFGFKYRYSFTRQFGLILAILSVIKLFLVDLSGLSQGFKIISYFALGATLITISFVYQYFSKRLDLKEEELIHVEKDN